MKSMKNKLIAIVALVLVIALSMPANVKANAAIRFPEITYTYATVTYSEYMALYYDDEVITLDYLYINPGHSELTCGCIEHKHNNGIKGCQGKELTCGKEEHEHGYYCYSYYPVCGKKETKHGHKHTANCYLICNEEEHKHTGNCYTHKTCNIEEHKHSKTAIHMLRPLITL